MPARIKEPARNTWASIAEPPALGPADGIESLGTRGHTVGFAAAPQRRQQQSQSALNLLKSSQFAIA
jgi:hypothetical protein